MRLRGLLVIVFLLNCQQYVSSKNKMVKFSKVAKEFAECIAAKEKATLQWWTVNATKKFFKKNPKYQSYKITVNVSEPLKYGKKEKIHRKIIYNINETKTNKNGTPLEQVLEKKLELKYNYTWKVKKGLKFGFPLTARIGRPPYTFVAVHNKTIDLGNKHRQSYNVTQSVMKKYPYSIPPKTRVGARLRVIAKTAKIPWWANVTIGGFITIALNKASPSASTSNSASCSGAVPVLTYKNIQFYRIDSLANDALRSNGAGGLNFTAEGFVVGVDEIKFKFQSSEKKKGKPKPKNKKKPKPKNKKKPNKNKKSTKKPRRKQKPGKKKTTKKNSLGDALKKLGNSIKNVVKSLTNKKNKTR